MKLRRMTYVDALEEAVAGAGSVLDVGCGNNSPLARFARRPPYAVGVDAYRPWLAESQARRIHDRYVEADVLNIAEEFRDERFDVVMACDVIEHLDAARGASLLAMMEAIASRRVVVLTPNGFVPQEATWGNPYQVHRSGWTVAEMRRRGYRVRGVNGLRCLREERGSLRFRPARAWELASRASQPLAWRVPRLAFHILCVKDV